MARPNKQGLDYFPLDVGIFENDKMLAISGEFSVKGEIIMLRLLCEIYRNGYFVEFSELLKNKLARLGGLSGGLVDEVVRKLVKYEFFDGFVFSEYNVLTSKNIQKVYLEASKRRKDVDFSQYWLLKEVNAYINHASDDINGNINKQSKGKESKGNISFFTKKKQKSASEKKIDSTENENSFVEDLDGKTSPQVAPAPPPDSEESKKTKKRFVPPTPEEVQNYCNERGNGISGTEFCDFYSSKGWKVGREPMKDWKAAVRTWEAKRKNNTQTNQTITIDEYGNRITNAGNSNTNTSTPYVFGRQTAEDLRANLSGW